MAQKVRAYTSWSDQAADEFSEWFWGLVYGGIIGGLAVSIPGALIGTVAPYPNTTRGESALIRVTETHAFLWGYALTAGAHVIEGFSDYMNETGESID